MGLGMKDILELIVWVIVVDFIISGVLIASAMFYLCNKVCRIKLRTLPSFFIIKRFQILVTKISEIGQQIWPKSIFKYFEYF
jgi:hypothetical protein